MKAGGGRKREMMGVVGVVGAVVGGERERREGVS
jgi:hypothetical protein